MKGKKPGKNTAQKKEFKKVLRTATDQLQQRVKSMEPGHEKRVLRIQLKALRQRLKKGQGKGAAGI